MSGKSKVRIAVIAIVLAISLFGIEWATPERSQQAAVRTFVEGFLKARLARDQGAARAYLSNDLHQDVTRLGDSYLIGAANPHYHAYRIDSIAPGGQDAWRVTVILSEEIPGQGEIGWFQEVLTVARVGSGYRVTEIRRGPRQDGAP